MMMLLEGRNENEIIIAILWYQATRPPLLVDFGSSILASIAFELHHTLGA